MSWLDGRKTAVTGGASGIGLACAALAVARGARVTILDIDPRGAERAQAVGADFIACDACKPEQIEAALLEVCAGDALGGLVTAVGGAHVGGFDDLTLDRWNEQLRFNLTSAYVPARAALPAMGEGSSIVTISSGYAYLPGPDRAAYCAAKAGVIALTRALAAAGAPAGVRANCVAPGPVDTPRFRAMNGGDEGVEQVRESMPLRRIPEPVDCAEMVCFLLSDAARNATGQVLHINGGLLMTP